MKNTKSMICNKLKDKLPEGWREKFVHRDCDQANYEFAMFEIDGENKILVRNPDTDDIMEYYYDDFDGKISISGFIESMGYKEGSVKYEIDRNYTLYTRTDTINKNRTLLDIKKSIRASYIGADLVVKDNLGKRKIKHFLIHRLIAFIFVPNPDINVNNIVNHKDSNRDNFKKENLEWCTSSYNNSSENSSPRTPRCFYIRNDGEVFDYRRLKRDSYCIRDIHLSIKLGRKYKGYTWSRVFPALEDYLSRHPIDPDGWYDDNGLHDFGEHKVRANSCGVLEVDGKLKVGNLNKAILTYIIKINGTVYYVHRLVYEIISGKLIDKGNVIDHLTPVSEHDINNSISNLEEKSQKENMANPNTIEKRKKKITIEEYNIFGDLEQVYKDTTFSEISSKKGISRDKFKKSVESAAPQFYGKIYKTSDDTTDLSERTKFIFYRWEISGGRAVCSAGSIYFRDVVITRDINEYRKIKEKYLNTGMPAPDGFYYQQGDPQNMIYDPDNKDLIKKRPEISWKKQNKNREDLVVFSISFLSNLFESNYVLAFISPNLSSFLSNESKNWMGNPVRN